MWLKAYLIALFIFLGLDALWLGLIAKNMYQQQIGHLMAAKVNFPAAGAFYLFFVAGLVVFAIHPAVSAGDWTRALLLGGFLGFLCYATYDLTNLATLKDWPLSVTLIDLVWGTSIGAVTAAITAFFLLK